MPRPFDEDLIKTIGSRMGEARRAVGMTQAELAEVIGIEAVTLSRYETGARSPSISTLARVADATETPLGALVDGEREMPQREYPPRVQAVLRELAGLDDAPRALAIDVIKAIVRHRGGG